LEEKIILNQASYHSQVITLDNCPKITSNNFHIYTLTQIAGEHQMLIRTLRRWVQRYRADGLVGLARPTRKDKDQRRAVTAQMQQFIEGLALEKPRRTVATIHREVVKVAKAREWKTPSYSTVERIVQQLDPALMTLAHEGSKAYREEFDVIYRHEASAPNEM
jgi:putative transposase